VQYFYEVLVVYFGILRITLDKEVLVKTKKTTRRNYERIECPQKYGEVDLLQFYKMSAEKSSIQNFKVSSCQWVSTSTNHI
jgi:hypothetical protein